MATRTVKVIVAGAIASLFGLGCFVGGLFLGLKQPRPDDIRTGEIQARHEIYARLREFGVGVMDKDEAGKVVFKDKDAYVCVVVVEDGRKTVKISQ